jgi:very-short-patch-repair endonuclease
VHPALRSVLEDQAGVVTRRQAESAGVLPHELRRLLRRRELIALHVGVYLDHTGRPSFLQRAWAASLLHAPAALAGVSALRAVEGPGSQRPEVPIHVAVDRDRHQRRSGTGIVLHRVAHLEERVLWHVGPPRLRYEEAALDVAASADSDFAALAELSRAVQSRRTTAMRLQEALARRERISRRRWMDAVLADVTAGTCSVLEHGYLHRVERAHGLAGARRQVRDRLGAGSVYRDVLYQGGVVVELDGRLFHDTTTQRDRDFDRDLDAAAEGLRTVRVSWGQVFERPCWTTARIERVLRRAGWAGRARACGPTCSLRQVA